MAQTTPDSLTRAKARQTDRDIARYRTLFFMGGVIYPSWWLILRYAEPTAFDPPYQRLLFGAACFIILGLSYLVPAFLRHLRSAFLILAYVMTTHYFCLVHLNGMEMHYTTATFVLVFAVGATFLERRDVFLYSAFVLTMALGLSMANKGFSRAVFLAGHATGLVVSYVALSTRLKLVESLMESEERFRTMADAAPVMIWVTDENGFASFFNDGWLAFTGNAMADAAGNGWTKSVHPEDLNAYLDAYFAAFRARKPLKAEYRLRRSDGEWRRVYTQSIPLYQPNGSFTGYIGTCVDITDTRPATGPAPAAPPPPVPAV